MRRKRPPGYPREANAVAQAVFEVLTEKVDPGEARKVMMMMPEPLRTLWPELFWAEEA